MYTISQIIEYLDFFPLLLALGYSAQLMVQRTFSRHFLPKNRRQLRFNKDQTPLSPSLIFSFRRDELAAQNLSSVNTGSLGK